MFLSQALPPTVRMILRALASTPIPMTPTELATATDSSGVTVQRHLRDMHRAGLVVRSMVGARSHYALPTSTVQE